MSNVYGVMVYAEVEADSALKAEDFVKFVLNFQDSIAAVVAYAVTSRQEEEEE